MFPMDLSTIVPGLYIIHPTSVSIVVEFTFILAHKICLNLCSMSSPLILVVDVDCIDSKVQCSFEGTIPGTSF